MGQNLYVVSECGGQLFIDFMPMHFWWVLYPQHRIPGLDTRQLNKKFRHCLYQGIAPPCLPPPPHFSKLSNKIGSIFDRDTAVGSERFTNFSDVYSTDEGRTSLQREFYLPPNFISLAYCNYVNQKNSLMTIF
jgi:hypothetical protein